MSAPERRPKLSQTQSAANSAANSASSSTPNTAQHGSSSSSLALTGADFADFATVEGLAQVGGSHATHSQAAHIPSLGSDGSHALPGSDGEVAGGYVVGTQQAAAASKTARINLRLRMLSFARRVLSRLGMLGLSLDVSSDFPASVRDGETPRGDATTGVSLGSHPRVIFWRAAEGRVQLERVAPLPLRPSRQANPYGSHICLSLQVDPNGVTVALELPFDALVDLRNAGARLADAGRALELGAALESLPEQFTLGLVGRGGHHEAHRAETDALRELLDHGVAQQCPLWLGWHVPCAVVLEHAELVDEQLEDALVALGPVYKLLAWAPDNDLLGPPESLRPRGRDDDRFERPRVSRRSARKGAPTRAERNAAAFREQGSLSGEGPAVAPAPPLVSPTSAVPPRHARPVLRRRASSWVAELDPHALVEKGVRVRILAGPFEGKAGTVQEVNGKGQAKVLLGLLAMWLYVRDLAVAPEGKTRRPLASSHRKPSNKP